MDPRNSFCPTDSCLRGDVFISGPEKERSGPAGWLNCPLLALPCCPWHDEESEPQGPIKPVENHVLARAEVKCWLVVGVVPSNFGTDLEYIITVVAQPDGVA